MASQGPEEIDCIISEFVNRPGSLGAPSETPMEIAVKKGCVEIVSLLHAKGAQTSADLELQMQGSLSDEMAKILKESGEERERLSNEVREMGYNIVVTEQLVGQLSRTEARFRENLEKMKEQLNVNQSLRGSLDEQVSRARRVHEMAEALSQQKELLKEAKGRILSNYCKAEAMSGESPEYVY